ncbi:ATP-grasp domain-containing protein [Azohydromonas caseinilytica]|uniref:ATP-grasp domain-containing protein n=1 Tax=Azohydromonas caseinilytica TaxID=2728836 RepID=A0A848FAE1_9BURK|nr:ATP-grasp domain-containing protein [Azohydromonas caseinilytica]NML15836.1 ATP-grasp domain-containing protein [Azohydromonas caseinilytica]
MQAQRVFVYEYLSGGGLVGGEDGDDEELLEQGVAMRDALVADLAGVPGLQVSAAATVPHCPAPPGVQWVSPRPDESPHDFVLRQAAAHDLCWIVAPETGGLLGCLRKLVGPLRWIGCDSAAIRVASSKLATLEHLARHGLPTPLDGASADAAARWVVKPDDGAGALHTRVHEDLAQAKADLRQRQRMNASATLEPWVDGEPLSLSLLCGSARTELLSINRQRVAVGADGALHFGGVEQGVIPLDDARAPVLQRLARDVVLALPGLRGCIGIDLVWHATRGPVLIEVNPRLTTAFVGLSQRLGRRLGLEVLSQFARAEVRHAA